MPKRFVFFSSLPLVGGHTTITLSIVKLLRECFDEVLVISRETPGLGTSLEAIEELKNLDVKTVVLKSNSVFSDIAKIIAETKDEWRNPDVYLAMGMRHLSPVLSLYLRPRRSVYYHITHELTVQVKRMLRCYSFAFSELAFISPATQHLWLENTGKSIPTSSIVQPTGVSFHCTPAKTDSPIRFGFIGRLNHGKGCQVLLDYARSSTTPGVLRVAGSGEFADAFKSVGEDDSLSVRVRFDGEFTPANRASYLHEFFGSIDYLVVPSQDDREGIPTVILEALSAGVPVVATRTGGMLAFEMQSFRCPKDGTVSLVDKDKVHQVLEEKSKSPAPNESQKESCKRYFSEMFSDEALLDGWKRILKIS